MRKFRIIVLAMALVPALFGRLYARGEKSNDLRLYYTTPGTQWMEALPLGNGRVGAMVWGQTHHEIIALNESTCWSGCASTENDNPEIPKLIGDVRQWIFDGQWDKVRQTMPNFYGRNRLSFGTNLELGRLVLDVAHASKHSQHYSRQLDLRSGVATVGYDNSALEIGALRGEGDPAGQPAAAAATHFQRELFVSNPDQVLVISFTSSRPGSVTFFAGLNGGDNPFQTSTEGNDTLSLDGDAFETLHSDGKTGVHFHGRLRVLTQGGKISAARGHLAVEAADSATLLLAVATSFNGQDPAAVCRQQIEQASRRGFTALKQAHISDHQRLFGRVELDLGAGRHANWPTDKRLEAVRNGEADPALAALLFQYARYLLIAGSRENSPLPMHLQGLWNDSTASRMPWSCDHHLDINVSMHYWPAEVGNLPECHVPLLNWVSQILRPSGRRTAKVQYQCRGWTADAISNAWGYSACGWGGWTPFVTGGTWIASHLWSHYLYTGDKQFLAAQAYPTLKENAEFFVDYVVRHPQYGWFVTGPSVSPENSFLAPDGKQTSWSMSPTVDVVLLRQLCDSCIAASEILNVDKPFREQLTTLRDNLPPFKVGRHGQLQEWLEDYEDAIPGHRHTCHLLAVYPFALITPNSTPELARAAEVTIQRRVTNPRWEDHGWSRALLAIQLARLGKGEAAYEHLQQYLKTFVYQNLLDFAWGGHTGTRYPIFCLDGNGGFATAVSEMLLQSYHGEIRLLPALPKAWPNGHLTGMCAEGGFEVAETWKNGRLLQAVVHSRLGLPCRIAGPIPLAVRCEGAAVQATREGGLLTFATAPGHSYVLVPN